MNTSDFKRMVLGLPHSAADYEGIETAAVLAETLGLDLLAALIEDAGLLGLAGQPYARELRPLGAGWQPVDAVRFGQELQQAADAMRLRFFERLRARNVRKRFQISRGTAAQVIGSLVQPTDIVVLFESRHPAERIAQQTADLVEAAFATASTIMIVPCHIARRYGPVVVLAAAPDDVNVRIAAAIASAAKEHLVVLNLSGRSLTIGDEVLARSVHIEEITVHESLADPRAIAAVLAGINERLLVAPLAPFQRRALQAIASLRGVPVLITDSKSGATITVKPEH